MQPSPVLGERPIGKRLRIHARISVILLCATAFALPVWGRLLPWLIGLFLLNWIISGVYLRTAQLLLRERLRFRTLGFSLVYLAYIAGLIHTRNTAYATEDLVLKLSLLIFPLTFATSLFPVPSRTLRKILAGWFLAGCVAGSLMLLTRAAWQTWALHQAGAFYYTALSWHFHTSYFSLYLVFAIAILLRTLLVPDRAGESMHFMPRLAMLLLFTWMIVLLSSKSGLLTLATTIVLFTVVLWLKQHAWKTAVGFISLSTATLVILMILFPGATGRLAQARQEVSGENKAAKEARSTGDRMMVWKASARVISGHWLTGVGTGDVKDALLEQYRSDHLDQVLKLKLNAHNQYIQTLVALGVPGLLLLAAMFLLPWLRSLGMHDWVYFSFLTMTAISFLFESMLETQAGVVFYALFNAVLFSTGEEDPARDPVQVALRQG